MLQTKNLNQHTCLIKIRKWLAKLDLLTPLLFGAFQLVVQLEHTETLTCPPALNVRQTLSVLRELLHALLVQLELWLTKKEQNAVSTLSSPGFLVCVFKFVGSVENSVK